MTATESSESQDRIAIYELVQRERVARDLRQWDALAAAYNDDSEVDIAWFRGTGAEFSVASARMAAGGLLSFHQMGPTIITLNGNRALSSTGCAIHLISQVQGIEVDIIGHARLYSRVERKTGTWLLSSFRVLYISDSMMARDPSRSPQLDAAALENYRPSYRFLSFMLAQSGHVPRNDLPGVDRPDTLAALLDGENAWLQAAS